MAKMEEKDIAIQITGLKKRYRLGVIGGGTLAGDLQSWWARIRHKEDPNSKVGSKTYGKNETFMALDGIDLTVYKGERIGIIGHNGAGKSTLLKLLSRVTGPTEGEIKLDGRISSMLEVGTGFNGELTGRENIYLNGAILGMTKAEIDGKIDKIIEFSECAQFIDTPVKRYSSGMYVKLAFAVASHLDSEILIMDEVLAVGDMAFQKKCLEKMSQVSKDEGRTILYVSHNMNTIRQLCDRCIVMNHGKIIYNGGVEEAIGIYLDVEKNQQEMHISYENERRPIYIGDNFMIKLMGFDLLNRSEYVFYPDEKIEFQLKAHCFLDCENISLRAELKNREGQAISSAFIPLLKQATANEDYTIPFSMDLSCFRPDRYTVTFVLFQMNDISKASMEFDVVFRGFSFELRQNENIFWNTKYWGNTALNFLEKK